MKKFQTIIKIEVEAINDDEAIRKMEKKMAEGEVNIDSIEEC